MLSELVDTVWVVSLPDARERRERIPGHLADHGITEFRYHDAFGPDAPEVQELYRRRLVMTFPPCFRCGRLRCDKEDCNNVLMPAQVANFASYLSLWERIASIAQVALIVEDDVLFHGWEQRVSKRLAKEVRRGRLSLTSDAPRLIRLGWGLSRDHKRFARFRIDERVRMANPCHIMTSAYARSLLDRFEAIDRTSDMFVHEAAPRPGEAVTVFPPIASELSWSVGSVESQIHPRKIRVEYLTQRGQDAAAESLEREIRQHPRHVFARDILCVGHPRSGTGFIASLCRQLGVDVGHEDDGRDGISSWMFAVDADESPWAAGPIARSRSALHWKWMIQCVRDPKTAAPSVIREDRHAPKSYSFRRTHILQSTGVDLHDCTSELDRAITSLCLWNKIIRLQSPDHIFRIEDGHDRLASFLESCGFSLASSHVDTAPTNADKHYQGVRHPKPELDVYAWAALPDVTKALLMEYGSSYGYDVSTLLGGGVGPPSRGLSGRPNLGGSENASLT